MGVLREMKHGGDGQTDKSEHKPEQGGVQADAHVAHACGTALNGGLHHYSVEADSKSHGQGRIPQIGKRVERVFQNDWGTKQKCADGRH